MKAGRLRHRMEIQRDNPSRDELGQPVENWVTLDSVNVRLVGLSGREFISRAGESAEMTHRIEMRAYPGLTNKDRLKFGSRIFEILYVADIEGRGVEMHVPVKELL